MRAQIAFETWNCWSFGRLSELQPWVLVWIWSCEPLSCATPSAAPPQPRPGKITEQGKTPIHASATLSHHSNAPIAHESQSILSKIVARSPRQWVARKSIRRQAHNLKVIGSNPIPATKQASDFMRFLESRLSGRLSYFGLCRHRVATENYFYTDGQAVSHSSLDCPGGNALGQPQRPGRVVDKSRVSNLVALCANGTNHLLSRIGGGITPSLE
jgi:hypothetical protein